MRLRLCNLLFLNLFTCHVKHPYYTLFCSQSTSFRVLWFKMSRIVHLSLIIWSQMSIFNSFKLSQDTILNMFLAKQTISCQFQPFHSLLEIIAPLVTVLRYCFCHQHLSSTKFFRAVFRSWYAIFIQFYVQNYLSNIFFI